MRFKNFMYFFFLFSLLVFSEQIKTQYIQNSQINPEYSKKINFSFSKIEFGKVGDYDAIIIDDCEYRYIDGFQIPYKVISFELEGEFEVCGANLLNYKTEEINKKINLARKQETEIKDRFLPGIYIETGSSANRGKTLISVIIYPIQYNPEKEKAVFLKEGEVEISYGKIEEIREKKINSGYTIQRTATPIPEECIIITPSRYFSYAQRLKNIHESQTGIGTPVSTRIFTTEQIASLNYGGTNQPPLASFPDSLCPDGGFSSRTGTDYPNRENILAKIYNDTLARKILSFLLDLADAPGYSNSPDPPYDGDGYYTGRNVQHILILGNAVDVPPSYYVHVPFWDVSKDTYNAWIPTDYFYACSGKNGITSLNPYYSVGRIPVSDLDAILYPNLQVASVDATNRRITASLAFPPGDLSDKQVIMRTGNATGRYLDISSWSWAGGILNLNFQPTAKMDGIAAGDRFDIVDNTVKLQQLDKIVSKIENWVNSINNNQSYFKNISFAGDSDEFVEVKWLGSYGVQNTGYVSTFYWNELSSLEVINSIDKIEEGGDGNSYVAGLGVKKYFESNIDANGNKIQNQPYAYLKNDIESVFKNDANHENGIFYFSGDGGTDWIWLHDDFISSEELLNYPSNTKNNIFISHGSNSAKFDREIWNAPNIKYSFGISSLISPSCSIAYFGPVRGIVYELIWSISEKGILNYSQKYINELTKLAVKHYHRAKGGKVKISDIITGAQREYYTKNQSSWDKFHFRTLVQFSLIGDPVIYIPSPDWPVSEYTNLPDAECQNKDRVNSDNFSVYEVNDNSTRNVSISFNSESPSLKITLVDPRYFTADNYGTAGGTGNISFTFDDKDTGRNDSINGPGLYFAKVEQQENGKTYYTKETRIYFEIVNHFEPQGDILLIDDDQPRRYTTYPNDPWFWVEVMPDFPHYRDVENYYEQALQDNNIMRVDQSGGEKKYKVWHVENEDGSNAPGEGRHGEVIYDVLSRYIGEGKVVIWFTGNDWLTTLKQKERDAIQQFLNNGGKLFITGQDIGYNIGSTPFYQNVLRARYVQDNIRLYNIDGISIDDLSGQFENIVITGGDGAYNQYWPSEIDPQSGASPIFLYDPAGAGGGQRNSSGCAGIKYYDQSTNGAFVYLSFGFEAINNRDGYSNGRKLVLKKILDWLGAPTPTGVFRAVPGDGEVYLSWVFPNPTDTNILILYKVGTGYPTGIPQNGQTYTPGQQIGDGTVLYVGTGTSYTHTGLTNGITYYYTAYVYDSQTKTYKLLGNASATPQAGGQPPGPGVLPPPTNLIASARWTGNIWVVDLSWQDNSTDEDGFEIERKEGQTWNKIGQVGANVRNYTDDNNGQGLIENTTYTYRVRAFRGSDYSSYSNEASTTTSLMLPPTNLQAIGGERSIYLIWQSTTSNQLGFEIERKHPTPTNPNDNYNLIATTGSENRTYSDLFIYPDCRPYYYRVRAYNQTDKTDYSNEAWGIPTAFPFNENPTNLQAFGGWNSIVVKWDDNTQNESNYVIELWWKRIPDDTSFPDTVVVVKGYPNAPFTGLCEATITESSLFIKGGRWYIRLSALHKTGGYGYSWYARPSPDFSNKPDIPSGLRYDQQTKWHYVWVDLPEIPSGGGGCFIATLCFGENSWQVRLLKDFRDRFLIKNKTGKKFVSFYYRNSPVIADHLRGHKFLIISVKFLLYFVLLFVCLAIFKIISYIIFASFIVYLIWRINGKKRKFSWKE